MTSLLMILFAVVVIHLFFTTLAARKRVQAEHTASHRAKELEGYLHVAVAQRHVFSPGRKRMPS